MRFWRELREACVALLLLALLAIPIAAIYLGAIWVVTEYMQ